MGWSRHDEDFRADHYRDERKHDPRPTDAFHLRTPNATALDVAALVQLVDVEYGAQLIEQYVRDRLAGTMGAQP